MSKTERQRIEHWLDHNGWEYSERSAREASEAVGGAAIVGGMSTFVIVFITGMLTGDPFSDWEDSKNDWHVPWWEETFVGCIILSLIVVAAVGANAMRERRMNNIRKQFADVVRERAVKTYCGLPDDEKRQLKPSLVDFLILEDATIDNPVFIKHRNAWTQLNDDVKTREELLAKTNASTAAEPVIQHSESVRNEIDQLRKDTLNELD